MIYVNVETRQATVELTELVTTGSVGMQVQFTFNEEWDGLSRLAVFRSGDNPDWYETILGDDNLCVIPWELLTVENEGATLFIGAEGSNALGDIVIPTIWASAGAIKPGVHSGNASGADPTPTQWTQIRILAESAATSAGSARESAETAQTYAEHTPIIQDDYWSIWNGSSYVPTTQKARGEDGIDGTDGEDGFSPSVEVNNISGGHSVSITSADSTNTFNVMDGVDGVDGTDGVDGVDGVSPNVEVDTITGGHAVTITDKSHPTGQTFNVMDGIDGQDGYSPSIGVATISGGHSITVTDALGSETFNVFDGIDGAVGPAGVAVQNTEPASGVLAWVDTDDPEEVTIPTMEDHGVLASSLAIVINGNSCELGASVGQFVILQNSTIDGKTDGLYTAAYAIPAGAVIDGAYLSPVVGGGLNALLAMILSL